MELSTCLDTVLHLRAVPDFNTAPLARGRARIEPTWMEGINLSVLSWCTRAGSDRVLIRALNTRWLL